ncbi:hypothetical protein [Haloparvum sedimenti]|uniref:hypothetical protein n=1 Tax=Haloparvum sedimenti TaxID=1678448 RepID=UPI00071E9047|nr:hypothetical protein [Haloparvum sedimenti]
MYLSHAVRSIRRDPKPDEEVGLVVEVDPNAVETGAAGDTATDSDGDAAAPAPLREAVAAADGAVVRDLGFDAWLVRVPETGIDALCEVDAAVRIETDATIRLDPERPVESEDGDPP